MGWYLGHFPGAKHVRNELVRINSLADVEQIIQHALKHPETSGDEESGVSIEALHDPELDLACAV
jgi:tRNA-dihydrouridine synthase B